MTLEPQEPTPASNAPDEMLDLVFDLREGVLDDAGAAKLNELLLSSHDNRASYVQFVQLMAQLEWDHALGSSSPRYADLRDANVPAAPMPSSAPRDIGNTFSTGVNLANWLRDAAQSFNLLSRPLTAALAASLATLLVVGGVIGLWAGKLPSLQVAPLRESPPPVAYLASAIGYQWGEESPRLQAVGSPVNLGDELTLQEGIAEFRLSNGVHLSIEGPAGIVVNSPTSVVLQYGKLTAQVPYSARRFIVLVGACRVAADKADFGVLQSGGDVEVHVFAGEASTENAAFIEGRSDIEGLFEKDQRSLVDRATESAGVLSRVTVKNGRAVKVAGDGDSVKVIGWGIADDSLFATRMPMAAPLAIKPEYVDLVLAAKPAGYWRFEAATGDVVENEVQDGLGLQIVGYLRLLGDSLNHVVEMGQAESDGFLAAHELTDVISRSDFSVEVWMRPSHMHAAAIVTMAGLNPTEGGERPAFYLGLHGSANAASEVALSSTRPGTVRFLNRDPPSGDYLTGTSCYSGTPYRLRQWQHVVAVKEGADMRLYLNGEVVATASDPKSLAPQLHLIVGEGSSSERTYRFRGQLDELAIYGRALSPEEVKAHFSAVQWVSEGRGNLGTESTSGAVY